MIAALAMVALIGCIAWAGAAGGLAFLFSVVLPYVIDFLLMDFLLFLIRTGNQSFALT